MNAPKTGKSPSHTAYQVSERNGGKPFWTRIGSAWIHNDAKGFNIQLDALPVEGRVVLRVVSEKQEEVANEIAA